MTTTEATAEVFWTAFQALPKKEKQVIFIKLVNDPTFREDLIDLTILEQRKGESSKSLNQYLAERTKEMT